MPTGKITPVSNLIGKIDKGGGTNDHDKLIHRDLADQHPMSAITGLSEKIAEQDEKLIEQDKTIEKATEGLIEIVDEAVAKTYGGLLTEVKERKAADDKLATDIIKNKEYTDAEITKVEQKITEEIDPKLADLVEQIEETKKYTDQEITKVEKKINDEIDPKLKAVSAEVEAETKRATEADTAINKRIDELKIEDVSTVTAERQIVSASELVRANVYDSSATYYEYTYPTNKNDFYGSWVWKSFDPDMLMYNPRYRRTAHPNWFFTQSDGPRFMYGAKSRKCSQICTFDLFSGGQPFDNDTIGIMYGSRLDGLMIDGWRDTNWSFEFDQWTNRTGWASDDLRDIVFYDHTDTYAVALPYLKRFAEKISDDTLTLPLPRNYIKTWVKANISESEFLANPAKYKKLVGTTVTKFTQATTYDATVEYYTKFTGVTDSSSLRGTWRIDKDPLDIDYEVKGWYFFINTDDTILREACPVFDGFILKKSEDGTQLIAQRYGNAGAEYDRATSKWTYNDMPFGSWVVYTKEDGWVNDNFRYISVAQQYCWYDNSTDAYAKQNLHYDYSLLNFLKSHATKIADTLIGADYYSVADFNNYLAECYTNHDCYKYVGKIAKSEFKTGVYFEKTEDELEKQTYEDIVRFAIETTDNKDTIIRSAIGKDVIKITDTNAVVNDYFTLAPETSVVTDTYKRVELENNAEISLTNLTDYIIFNVPSTVQHGYCSSVVLVIPESVTTLPYLILNNSKYSLQMVQAGNIVEKLEFSGNCQYNLLFMCNGVKLELYVQEIILG